MSEVLERKVGIVSCSGEELAEGTVARLAALKVLNELRPRDTVTICLPLFLAGGAGDRAFAKLHPTITVDGCDLRCAARGTEKYSSKPAASLVVNELGGRMRPGAARRTPTIECRRAEGSGGHRRTAGSSGGPSAGQGSRDLARGRGVGERGPTGRSVKSTCSCGSGVAVTKLTIDGQTVELVALPLIFRHFRDKGRGQDEEAARDLFETVKVYNAVPEEAEASLPRGGAARVRRLLPNGDEAMSRTATYHTTVRWTGEHWGHLIMGNGPEMKFSAPPDAHGHAGVLTPEDAFVAAANTCVMMMFIWATERFKLKLVSFECRTEGTKLIELDRTEIFTRLHFRPVIRIAAAGEPRATVEARTRRALQAAQKYSLVANSVKSEIVIEPEIIIDE